MKKILSFVVLLITVMQTFGQSPEKFNYQAVCRDGNGAILANQQVNFRISIHDLSSTGTIVYQETHFVKTNPFGLANFEVGGVL